MPKLLLTMTAAMAFGTLAACATPLPGTPAPAPEAQRLHPDPPPPTTTTPPEPETNDRGLIPMTLGDTATIGDAQGELGNFTIASVKIDPPCHDYGIRPDSGHTLVLDVRVSTGSDPAGAQTLGFLLNPFSFSEIGKDGVTRPAELGMCLDHTRHLPLEFGLNQKYTGVIELVVPEASGTVALQDPLINGGGGWEWTY